MKRSEMKNPVKLYRSTGSCSFEPNSTKGLKPQVSYIAMLRMTHLVFLLDQVHHFFTILRTPCLLYSGASLEKSVFVS